MDINKKLGAKMAFRGDEYESIPRLPTGITGLDMSIGQGLPMGKYTEIYGLDGCGKSTLAMQIVAHNPKIQTLWIDAESAFNSDYAKALGVDMSNITILTPKYGEQVIDLLEEVLNEEQWIVVLDSVSALMPKSEVEASVEQQFVGGQARMYARMLRKLLLPLKANNSVIILLNQLRHNIQGTMYNPYTRSGGKSVDYYPSLNLELKRIGSIKEGERIVGAQVRANATKSRICPPNQKVDMDFIYGKGFSAEVSLFNQAFESGVITKSGNTYYFGDTKLGVGKKKATETLEENPDLANAVSNQV